MTATMIDHAPRLQALKRKASGNSAIEKLEQLSIPLLWAACLVMLWGCGLGLYIAGHTSALRECPPVQQGERLLSSEQRDAETVCRYAEGWADYGRRVKTRKVKS